MDASHRAGSRLAAVVAIALFASACGSQASPAIPVSTPDGSIALPAATVPSRTPLASGAPWADASVALPTEVTSAATEPPGVVCSPCHSTAEDQFLGIASTRDGFVAVGVQQPPAQAIAFGSRDGRTWAPIAGFPAGAGSTAIAAVGTATATVVVGSNHDGAMTWASSASGWSGAPRQASILVPYAAGAMTSVIAFGGGFVAGGYRDDPLAGTASAAIWHSADGLVWTLDAASVFAGGRILGLAAEGGTLVAVGTSGDPNYGPVGAWRWTQADGWQRATILPDDGGAMRAVVGSPRGFVAVGLDAHDAGARTWTSPDGMTWTAAPDQTAFHHGTLPVRMQAIAAESSGFVAGGWRSDVGKGSAVSWTSPDGVTWTGPVWQISFSGAQITGVALGPTDVVAVGRTGYPDNNQASAWVQPIP